MCYSNKYKRKILSFIFFILTLSSIISIIYLYTLPMKLYNTYEYIDNKVINSETMEIKFDQPMKIKVIKMSPFKYSSRYKIIYEISVPK